MSLVTGSASLSPYTSSASTANNAASSGASTKSTSPLSGVAGASSTLGVDATDKTGTPASSTTVTLSTQGLNMSHAPAMPPPAATSTATTAAPPEAPASPSIYDDVKNGIEGAVDDVGAAIGGTARWIGNGVVDVVSGVDALVHGVVDLPFAVGAEACNAVGAVLDAL